MANTGGIDREELSKLFFLADDLHGRAVPLHPVYDPEYDGEHMPDWADDPDWFLAVIQNGEVHWVDGYPAESRYFGKEAASDQDVFFPFVHVYTQHASWPSLMGILERIEDDIQNLAVCMSKIALYQHLSQSSTFETRRFVVSEIEYIFSVCRSLYDLLQDIARNSWDIVQLEDGGKNALPSSFASMALSGDEPVPVEKLEEKYGLSPTLAEFYESEAEEFARIRSFRDSILHHGRTMNLIFVTEEGYSVQSSMEPFTSFDVWDDDTFLENDLAPIWPPIAYAISHTIGAMNRFSQALTSEIAFPPEIAPEYKVFIRGPYVHNLGHLGELMNEDVWGQQLVEEVEEELDTETAE